MDKFNADFFSTIAQISATFMGFALLVPAIKALSSGLLIGSRKYIKPHVLVKKFFFFISFPLFVLANPLIVSLTILPNSSLSNVVRWFVYASALFFPFWLWWMQKNSKPPGSQIVRFILDLAPWIFIALHLLFVFLFLMCKLWRQSFWLFLSWDTLFLVLSGVVLILRNLMISPEDGIVFSSKEDVKEKFKNIASSWTCTDNESLPKDVQGKEETLLTIREKACDAIKKRKKLIELFKKRLEKQPRGTQDEKRIREIKLTIAESNVEIKNVEAFLDDIKERFKANILDENKKYFTLSNCADIEKRLDKAKIYLWEFQQGTTRLEEFNEVFREENCS